MTWEVKWWRFGFSGEIRRMGGKGKFQIYSKHFQAMVQVGRVGPMYDLLVKVNYFSAHWRPWQIQQACKRGLERPLSVRIVQAEQRTAERETSSSRFEPYAKASWCWLICCHHTSMHVMLRSAWVDCKPRLPHQLRSPATSTIVPQFQQVGKSFDHPHIVIWGQVMISDLKWSPTCRH